MQSRRWPRPSRFREALREGRPPVTMWMTLQSPNVVEMAGALGLDTAIIDLEHTTSSVADAHTMILAAHAAGMTALVRTPGIDRHEIGRLLDGGADGIVIPMVCNRTDAEAARASVRYPPRGRRGWAGTHARHVRWTNVREPGVLSREFVAAADDSIASIFMIENAEGIANVDEILEVGAPDAVIFGWGDFTVDVDFDQDQLTEARHRIHDACRRRGIGLALSVDPPDPMPYFPGCFFSAGVDATLASTAIAARMREVDAAIEAQAGGAAP